MAISIIENSGANQVVYADPVLAPCTSVEPELEPDVAGVAGAGGVQSMLFKVQGSAMKCNGS